MSRLFYLHLFKQAYCYIFAQFEVLGRFVLILETETLTFSQASMPLDPLMSHDFGTYSAPSPSPMRKLQSIAAVLWSAGIDEAWSFTLPTCTCLCLRRVSYRFEWLSRCRARLMFIRAHSALNRLFNNILTEEE